ncbi:class I SAM-dependent methyltransferase [Roseofilum sp. BLCC_M154]|uniref:Class I SAM-dependent methyltransferase n=1 Tax=Roseofilum acuticapitatum BLCC-M154 TaxID=3022444 RepID=A0ABT7ARI2_9CYAN|nr:class I SAM-dependent methyltransferase [Roseofilum acuticapitatum]MDJ1169515.1 class I SAM-dependent methyltransferase [Roseofilum acuticapitatum BLCC-M154]
MPTVEYNLEFWSNYSWSDQGDEWSHAWGGTEFLWWGTLYPRIQAFIPTGSILEIAPGYGRFTTYFKDYCQELTIVDLAEPCIEICQKRFANYSHIKYYVNDGKSLDMIPDQSIDFVFSFDSLVHAESDVIEAYLMQLGRKLKPNGAGFFHHSNIGHFKDSSGNLPFPNPHMRAESMTARLFDEYAHKAGLQCLSQEWINWGDQDDILKDCLSTFKVKDPQWNQHNRVLKNPHFMEEARRLQDISVLYRPSRF